MHHEFLHVFDFVCRDATALRQVPAKYRADPDVVLTAIARYPEALRDAGEKLLASRRFMIEAVHCRWESLDFAPERWRSDHEVLRAAVRRGAPVPGPSALTCCPCSTAEAVACSSAGGLTYEGEALRLVSPSTDWSVLDSQCRFRRVLRGRDCSGADPKEAAEVASPPVAPVVPREAADGAVRHRLVVHLVSGYLRFHVVSCLWVYALAVVPAVIQGRGSDDAGVLSRDHPLPAALCDMYKVGRCEPAVRYSLCGGAEKGFAIQEKSGAIVSIFVELFLGDAASSQSGRAGLGAAGTGRRAAVWYVLERDRSLWGKLVGLHGDHHQDKVTALCTKPWTHKGPALGAGPAQGGGLFPAAPEPPKAPEATETEAEAAPPPLELVADVLEEEGAEGFVQKVLELSQEVFAVGFGALQGREDLAPGAQLTVAATASRGGVLGYLLYECSSSQPGGARDCLKVMQLAVAEPARRRGCGAALLRWAEGRAKAAGCSRLEARALKLSMPFYRRQGFAVKRGGRLDPDGVDVELVLKAGS